MTPQEHMPDTDRVATTLRTYAQNIIAVIFGLLPLIFIPTVTAPFEYTKVFAALIGVFLALILYSLSALRAGSVRLHTSYALGTIWLVALGTLVSALLSGDLKDALIGDLFSVHAAAFVALLALIPSVWVLLRAGKAAVMRMYMLLAGSAMVLIVFHVLRVFFGPSFLGFGLFEGATMTPVGSWNDLGLFLGLVVILSLVALEQLSLTRFGKIFFGVVTAGALFMLAIINFFTIWVILGFASLVMIVFTLGRDRTVETQLPLMDGEKKAQLTASFWQALAVFLVSVLFVIGGSGLGGWVAKVTGVSYIEVRPSFEATADIARAVYADNVLLGAGTNRFSDAWRMHKDDAINATVFWNTDFNAGNGYIPTFFVTTGLLGGILWLLFFGAYVVTGVRTLLAQLNCGDRVWYFIGVSSFLSALYVWGLSFVYVPGAVILLLGALCTGVSLHAFSVLAAREGRVFSVTGNRRARFLLTIAVVVIIISSVGLLYATGRHYSAVYAFNTSILAMQSNEDVSMVEEKVASAFRLFSSDLFARRVAEYQLLKMNSLAGVESPGETEQKQFSDAVALGVNAVDIAIENDREEPANYALRGGIYSLLTSLGFEGAYDRAAQDLNRARELNPKNPSPYLELAMLEARASNIERAREYINQAIQIKPNFIEAFFLLSQLEIATGNTEAAIESTRATIALDPQNPVRYYQLGILERARNNPQSAALAFEQAITFDTNFANARYHLALSYDELGRGGDAITQLEKVLELNPGNEDVTTLINVLRRDGSLQSLRASATQAVTEQAPVTTESGTVYTPVSEDSSVVTPVNTPPQAPEAETPTTETAPAAE